MSIKNYHNDILDKIKVQINEKCELIDEEIKIKTGVSFSGYFFQIQLILTSFKSEPIKNIHINFDVQETNPEILIFETIHGMKKYSKSKNYIGLIDDVVDYINYKQ